MSKRSLIKTNFLRILLNPALVLTISAIFLVTTISLTMSAQNSQSQGGWFTALLVVNIAGIIVLLLFLVASLTRLVQQYRNRVLGSRLMVRFVILFIILTTMPIGVVYYFSAQFLSKSIDSWFDDKIEQALDSALLLGQGFLEASKQNLIDNARIDAGRIAATAEGGSVIGLLGEIREQRTYTELDLFERNGRVIASSNINAVALFPDSPEPNDMSKAAAGEVVVKLEPMSDGALRFRLLYPMIDRGFTQKSRVLQIIESLPLRYSNLGSSLEQASSEYSRLRYLRGPLKISFLLTLSLITLMTTLVSTWLAIYAARRLVAPIADLAAGTRAVTEGDYSTQLPVKSDDELGTLVSSFNAMITQVRLAQDEAHANHLKEQNQRAYLQSVLSNLSSGVLSFNRAQSLQTHNASASAILDTDLGLYHDLSLAELHKQHPELKSFCEHLIEVMNKGMTGEKEIRLNSEQGTQLLMVRTSGLSVDDKTANGWVVVFDDVSNLVHAERDAAWGEVARRLAHEIKNPLTPIGLSAERIRRKYLHTLPEEERPALDRSTRTIAEQVQTLKRMVDAFSNYARSERLALSEVDLNRLVGDVVELHHQPDHPIHFVLDLDQTIGMLKLDQDGIRQILNNVIGNACDALSETAGATIRVSTCHKIQRERDGVNIIIQDNGPGFDEKIIHQVFEPYVTAKTKGTGLGMAIVKRIVQAHGGFVVVSNHDGYTRNSDGHGPDSEDSGGGQVKVWLPTTSIDNLSIAHE